MPASLTTMALPRYTGNISAVDVNKLQFFKIHEGGLYPDMKWATDRMIAASGVWNATIPHDIQPGTYIVRHEILALHFATMHSNAAIYGGVGPQFYVSCYNVKVTGSGTATPPGVTFPGAHQPSDPGLVFDIFMNNPQYPIPGPKVYSPVGTAPVLNPNKPIVVSPMGDPAKDAEYNKAMEAELRFWEATTSFFEMIGG